MASPSTKATENNRSSRHRDALRATFISSTGQIAVRCPWCERTHYHGDAGKGGTPREESRGAGCSGYPSSSPYVGTGYTLKVEGATADPKSLAPSTPKGSLHDGLAARNRTTRRNLLAAILGKKSVRSDPMSKRLADGTSLIVGGDGAWWQATNIEGVTAQGNGLPSLAAHLWGVPEPIAAVRILEAAISRTLDRQALDSFLDAFEAWIERGRPERPAQ